MNNNQKTTDCIFAMPYDRTAITLGCSYALILSYESKDQTRKWSLSFQNEPCHKVIFTGDEPTTEEIVETLAQINLPIYMVNVFKSVIGQVKDRLNNE